MIRLETKVKSSSFNEMIPTSVAWLWMVSMMYFSWPHSRCLLAPITSDILLDTFREVVESSPTNAYFLFTKEGH